ncbi:MAG: hypothetical protein KatS3mg059_0415 [Thermomicrobiales bacterium]|nr:MAG: hypothetical protein KatS3mg059_0415 [Thermomicrobiales bacterium]
MGIIESEILAALLTDERLRQAQLLWTARMAAGRQDIPALIFTTIGSMLIMTGFALWPLAHCRRITMAPLSPGSCGCPR